MRQTFNQELEIQSLLSEAIRIDDGQSALSYKRALGAIEALDRAGFSIMPKIADGRIDALYEASRTGSWSGVSEREWKAWGAAIHAGYISKKAAVSLVQPDKEILISSERPSGLTDREHAVLDAELVIARSMRALMGVTQDMNERAHCITQALAEAGFEIRYVPLDLVDDGEQRQQVFSVRIGWPEFTTSAILVPDLADVGADVATVTRAAKLHASNSGGNVDRSRWVTFSWTERRFLAPDEKAPPTLIVGPYEALVRECRPPELPKAAADADLKRYEGRWEDGLRNIVTILHGPSHSFEIGKIVEEVRTLTGIVSRLPDESRRRTEHHSFGEDDPFTTISGDATSVERILDLIEKGEAAVKAEREPEITITFGDDTVYLRGTPESRKELMQFLLKDMREFAKGDVSMGRRPS